MPTTRVVLLDIPLMLRELLLISLAAHADVEVLESAAVVDRWDFDLAIVPLSGAANPLADLTRPRVLGLDDDGRQGYLYELRPHRTPLGELSEEVLANVLHSVAGGGSR